MTETSFEAREAFKDKFFAHYGTKGMKWGVRNDRGHEGERATTKAIAKADKKFEKSIASGNAGRPSPEVRNAIVSRMNRRIQDLNDSPKYRNVDLNTAKGPIADSYAKDSKDAIVRSFEDAIKEHYGSNASGTKKGVYNAETDQIDIVDKDVQHSEVVIPDYTVTLERNAKGFIVATTLSELDETGELKHYGVKGMKWGKRKHETRDVTVSERPGRKVKAKGGTGQSASDDAKRIATVKQKAKASTTDALSNKELQDLVTRMNLEQQYARLNPKKQSKGKAFVQKLFTNQQYRDQKAAQAQKLLEYPIAAVQLGNQIQNVRL